jgi:putative transposase
VGWPRPSALWPTSAHAAKRPPRRRRSPARKPAALVVERTHAWMNHFRSLLIRWAKKPENYLGLLHFVCGLIAYRAAGLFG